MNYISFLLVAFLSLGLSGHLEARHKKYETKKYHHKHSKGLKRKPHKLQGAKKTSFLEKADVIPKTYSLRGQAGPVENQGSCGSCWDFSLTSVLRGTFITAGQDPGRLSFNYLLNCASDQYGCGGGDFDAADWFIDKGIKGDYAYDAYTARQGRCNPGSVVAKPTSYSMLGGNNGPSFKDIAYTIAVLKKPISVDVAAGSGDWENYSGGVYDGCSGGPNSIDHMVAIESYDCETSVDANGNCVFDANGNLPHGVGTVLIRNSWGTEWGDAGYIDTKFTDQSGRKCNAIATDALIFDVAVTPPTPPTPPVPPPTPPTPPVPPAPSCHGFLCGIACWLPWCN